MTENATFDVGRAIIDAYLNSVEQELLATNALRSDRAQVLQDLESQIADMLAQQPQPLTEGSVQAVIAKLEPASHFAAMYANGKQPRVASPGRISTRRGIRWSYVAAACIAVSMLGGILLLLGAVVLHPLVGPNHDDLAMLMQMVMQIALFFGFVAAPGALGMAYAQLRAQPGGSPDRDLVLKMIIAYAIMAPALVMAVLTEWTYGLVLVPFGILGFIYLQYWLVRRLHRYLADHLPPQSATAPPSESSQRPAAPVGTAMSMTAI